MAQNMLDNRVSSLPGGLRVMPWPGAQASRNLGQALPAQIAGTPAARITLDRHGIVRAWNPAASRLLGYSAPAALDRPLDALVSPPGRSQLSRMLRDFAEADAVCTVEVTLRRADDTLVVVALTFAGVRDPAGRMMGIALVGRVRPAHRSQAGSIA